MTYGTVRLTVKRKCPNCDAIEEVRTTKFTEEHHERVIDEDEHEFSIGFDHDDGCTYDGPPRVLADVHQVDDGLPTKLKLFRREAEVAAEEAEGENVTEYAEAKAKIEVIDRIIDEVDARGP